MKVVTPTGEKYRVRRKWLPWRRKAKPGGMDFLEAAGDLGDDPISTVIAAVLLVPVVIIMVVFLGEFLLLLLLLPLAMIARSIFGKPWTIEVTQRMSLCAAVQVKGWRASRERIRQLAKLLQSGGLAALHAELTPLSRFPDRAPGND